MFKKITATLLVAIMLICSVPSALAAKKEDNKSTENICALWGGFNTPEEVLMVKIYNTSGGELSFLEGGADDSAGSLKFYGMKAGYMHDVIFPFVGFPGETYEISVDFKFETAGMTGISYIFERENGYNQIDLPLDGEKKWKTYSFTFTAPENNQSGVAGGNFNGFKMRFKGVFPCTILIDNLTVTPKGLVPGADYSSINNGFISKDKKKDVNEYEKSVIRSDSVEFSDVSGHWAENTIESLAKYEYLNGMGDGTFAPEAKVTRAQFIKMMTDTYDVKYPEYDGRFKDVEGDEWYADILYFADQKGFIDVAMKAGGKINPDSPITREEAATIARKVAMTRGAKENENAKTSFGDDESISLWAIDGVKESAKYGLISGYTDGTFKPKNNITRAEAAQILYRVVECSSRLGIYVDSQIGDDNNDGTQSKPLKTIYAARDMAAKYQDKMQNDITIYIRGEQYLDKTFELDENNSGNNGYSIIYTSWGEEKPVLTMAKKYKGFELHDAEKNIYKTYVGVGTHTRQAFFNDVRGIRARTVGYLENVERIDDKYFLCDNPELLDVEYPKEVDAIFHVLWVQSRFLLSEIVEENGRIRINMSDYFGTDPGRVLNSGKDMRRGTPSYLENSYQFLDQKGEWYLNRHDGYMYYIPRNGEDIDTLEVKIPLGEEMIVAKGSSYENSLENIVFDNIIFEGTTWLEPDRVGGHSPRQNNLYTGVTEWEGFTSGIYSEGETPEAAVHFSKCKNITISNSLFHQIGINGLNVFDGAKNVDIIGNEFCDISATSMAIDDCGDTGHPSKRSEESYVEYVDITNNYIHNVSIDYQGAAAVSIGWPRHTKFNHNEVAYTQYSGTHTGYNWGAYDQTGSIMYDLELNYNYIHDIMVNRINDGSGMYFLGKGSFELDRTPESNDKGANKNRVVGNYLVNGWQSDLVYPDQNSGMWYIAENVADVGPYRREVEYNFDRNPSDPSKSYWLHMWHNTIKWMTVVDNYSTHDYAYKVGHMNQTESYVGPTNIYPDRDWPDEAKAIIANAGIEKEYQDNFKLTGPKMFVCNDRWQDVEVGVPVDSGILILGDYNTKYPVEDFDIDFWCEDPDAVTMDEHGKITAHKEGEFECEAFVTIDGMVMSQHWILNCYDGVSRVGFDVDTINVIEGNDLHTTVNSYTSIGGKYNIMTAEGLVVDVEPEDKDLLSFGIDETGSFYVVKALKRGKTSLKGTITYQGITYDVDIPVTVSTYGSEEAESLPFKEVNLTGTGWNNNFGGEVNGGMLVSSNRAHYSAQFENELIAFDMEINDGSGWPSIAFCDSDIMGDYSTNDCYMIGFKNAFIELQRWNKGERTMIFGEASYNPIGGPGVPNLGEDKFFEYNKRYSVVMGALDTPEGTRIILTINGENIIDYLDNTSGKLKSYGYYVSYNPAPGGTTFYPYTGITNK